MDLNSDYLRLERKPLCHRKKKKKSTKAKSDLLSLSQKRFSHTTSLLTNIADVLGIALNSHEGGQQRALSVIGGCIQTVSFLAYTNVCVT